MQGLFELSGIPLVGCGTLASALCMDKDRAHKLVSLAGIAVPKSVVLEKNTAETRQKILDTLSFPVFVKPVRAGSSFGVARVESRDALGTAVDAAFRRVCRRVFAAEVLERAERLNLRAFFLHQPLQQVNVVAGLGQQHEIAFCRVAPVAADKAVALMLSLIHI